MAFVNFSQASESSSGMLLNTMFQNALLVALLVPLAWLAAKLLRNQAVAHKLWVILLVKLVTPGLVVIPIGFVHLQHPAFPSVFSHVKILLSAIWIIGSIGTMLSFLRKAEALRRIVVRHGAVHPAASDLAKEIDRGGAFLRTPEVILVDAVHSPLVCGIGASSWILIPKDLWFSLKMDERRSLVAHELAHFRRGDCLVRLLEVITTVLFWWHPALWLVKDQIEQAEEDCCDALARRFGAKSYARAVLTTLDFLQEPETFKPPVSAFLLRRKSRIERRITRILRSDDNPEPTRGQRFSLFLFAIVILTLSPQVQLF